MINTIRHFLFDVPLFTDKKKYFLRINELIYLLRGHFSASDNDCHPPSDSPFQPTSFSESSFSRKSSASPVSTNIPPSKLRVSLDLRVSPSQPRTGLLRHFSIISRQEYLDAIHEEDLVRSDEREDEEFSATLKAAEQKLLKRTRDRVRQRAHRARVKNVSHVLNSSSDIISFNSRINYDQSMMYCSHQHHCKALARSLLTRSRSYPAHTMSLRRTFARKNQLLTVVVNALAGRPMPNE